MKKQRLPDIMNFNFAPGRVLAKKYEVRRLLGSGWEGEVYRVREQKTGIERAAKFFYPHRNPNNKSLIRYARVLHKLRKCPIVIQYLHQDSITFRRRQIYFLVSEFVEGEPLKDFLLRQPGKRLAPFQAVHLLYALTKGIENIHQHLDYHGDIHIENIMVQRFGLGFDIKLIDFFRYQFPLSKNKRDDIIEVIRVFYESLGGVKYYARQPKEIKQICCGLKKSLILKKFKSARKLREHLETVNWS